MKINKIWNPMYTILFVVNVILNVSFYMISTALSKHLVEQGMSVVLAGTIIGAMPMAAMLIRPFSGWICDHFQKKWLLLFFLLLNGMCVAGYGIVEDEAIYMTLRIMHGISFGMTTTVTMALVASYIPQGKMGEGLGYFGLAQTLAMAIGPGTGLALTQAAGSQFMFFFASMCIAISILLVFFLHELQPPVVALARKKLNLRVGAFIAKEAILFAIISFALSSANGIETSYIALYGESLGYTNIGWYFTVSAVALFVSRALCGKLVDKRGFSFVFYPAIVLVSASLLLLSYADFANGLIIFGFAAILKAIGVGAIQPAMQAAVVQRVSSERRGAATSTFFIGTDLGQASAPVLAGNIIDTSGYANMFRIYTLPLIAVCMMYVAITVWNKKRRRSRDVKQT